MAVTRENMLAVADDLQGTCKSLDAVLSEDYGVDLSDVPADMLAVLDEQVQLCETCGWWGEPCDFNEDGECTECSPETE